MTARHHFLIFLALALVAICGLALAGPQAYGQMATLPKYDTTLALDPASPAPGSTARVTVNVSYFYYQLGKDPSVPNVYVRYSLSSPSGEVSLPSDTEGYTNAQGYHSADITIPSSPGEYTVNVYAYDVPGGEVFGQGAARFTVKAAAATHVAMTSTPTPTEVAVLPTAVPPVPTPVTSGFNLNTQALLIIGAVIAVSILFIVFVLAILAFLWTRRKLVVAPATAGAPGDGQSVIPVRVKFTNGLGMARRMKEDTAVEMSTTAGSIQNVVINKEADFAETGLATSKEFGAVTITAKAGKKTATAKVRFTNDNARLGFVMVPDSLPADGTSSATVGVRVVDADGNVIAPLEDLPVDLKTTLGKVTGRTVIKAKALEASAEFTTGTTPGNAVITATSGPLKCEATLAIREKPGRFCMHCGAPMEAEASSCPRCSLTPPSGVDTKQCPACGTVIPESAMFCYQCGARQPKMVKPQQPQDSGAKRN